nr:retrovirus-related Pol polyprotein from transposon TNT 1-94 [Tanacetum cinerariifolium]
MNARVKSKSAKKPVNRKIWQPTGKLFTTIGHKWRPTGRTFTLVENVCPLTRITTTDIVPLRKPIPIESNTSKPVVTLVYLRKSKAAKKKVPVVQIVLWYLDSGCSKHMTGDRSQLINFVHKFLGTVKFGNDHVAKIMGYGDYKIGNVTISRVCFVEGLGHNLFSVGQFYDLDLEVAFCQHTCFILNLDGADLLIGSRGNNLYTLYLKDMMASSPICLLSKASKTKSWLWHRRLSHLNFGKRKKKSHKPKSEDTNQEKLYLLHMDLCGPMRVESINGKKYILVIVDDYSRFTWVKCLRSKDEALDFIIKFLKMIQLRLKVLVRHIQTDNGPKFVNQTLREYYEQVGISHETSVARSSQQNGVVERRNRTLIEAARAIENLGKLQPKADIEIFIGYAPTKKAFWIYNKRTRRIVETIHVDFDELTAMASEQRILGPALNEMTPATISSGLVQKPSSVDPLAPAVIAPIADVIPPVQAESTSSPSSTTVDQDAPSPSKSQTTLETQSSVISQDVEEDIHDIKVAHMGNDPLFGVKEYQENDKIGSKPGKNGKRTVEDKILVPKPPKNCARCTRYGYLVDGPNCQGCALLRQEIKENLVTYSPDFQNTSEPSNDSTNVVISPREPYNSLNECPSIFETSSQSPPNINHCCYECGDPLDGIFCKRCTCKSCGKDANIGYNCPSKVPVISNQEPCNNQTIDELPQALPIFHPTFHSEAESPFTLDSTPTYVDESLTFSTHLHNLLCILVNFAGTMLFMQYTIDHPIFNAHNSYLDSQIQLNSTLAKIKDQMTSITSLCEMACQVAQKKLEEKQIEEERAAKAKRNSYVYDPNPNSFNCPPDSYHPPHPTYETYSYDSYGNDSQFGYDCKPQFPLNYESKPGYNENYTSYPYDSSSLPQQYLCCARFSRHSSTSSRIEYPRDGGSKAAEKLLQEEQWAYLSTHSSKHLPSFCFDDDEEDYTSAITPDEPILSTEEPDNSLSIGDEHLDTISATKSNEFIKSGVENLILIPSESEGVPEHVCDVPSHDNSLPLDVSKDQIKDFSESNEEFSSTDDDSFSFDKIDYVEASPPDSELVSSEVMEIVIPEVGGIDDDILLTINHDDLREKLLNVNLLIAKIEALNANPTPSSDCKTKSSSTSLNSLLEETNTFDNSLLEFETFCFDVEEISSGSTTTPPDISLPEYEAFYDDHVKETSSCSPTTHSDSSLYASFMFDISINPFPPADRSDSYEFIDELIPFIFAPEYDCFLFKIEPNSGDFTKDVVEDISPTKEPQVLNTLPTHPIL